jgi:tetratricopeptide (TPR) repeat protein
VCLVAHDWQLYDSHLAGWFCAGMHTFSTAQIAKILKVGPAWVRAQARRTLVDPTRTRSGHYRYSFQDIVLLRAARRLCGPRLSTRRIAEILSELSRTLPADRSLSSVQLRRVGSRILARDAATLWEPESGQTLLDFEAGSKRNVAELPIHSYAVRESDNASDWFDLAMEYENGGSTKDAERAYRRARERDPLHINCRINLGRLRHGKDALEEAEALYREALDIDPRHPIALFNLGVVLEDRGDDGSAIECYKRSIDADSEIPEAHYNLARLYVRQSSEAAEFEAIRHYARYKALTRGTDQEL